MGLANWLPRNFYGIFAKRTASNMRLLFHIILSARVRSMMIHIGTSASIMINLMLQDRPPIIYGDGSQQRCFSFIDDCLYCLKEMAFRNEVVGQVINIGPDEEVVSINDLVARIANQIRFNKEPLYLPGRPKEVKNAICSSDKARAFLNYKTTVSLDDGLAKMIEYIKKRGVRPFKYHIDLEITNDRTPRTWTDRLF